ncbi:jhamt [Trichonephila clavata]|uniref:Jhamt n=1 Tax=Trichonephila clavata TaxID=2740835 RepID=A0A8X6L993_TRICU|nr:jhamt [Trichonephila clavata]
MAQSSLSSETSAHDDDNIQFVQRCADEFQWKDLSEDVVMDIGCGEELNCCKAILMQFPEVKELIAVDQEITTFLTAHIINKVEFCVGDILLRDSLELYEGKMDKVISTDTFHQIKNKEKAFRNVYHMLKPGGEAGFYFCVKACMYTLLTVLSKIPKYGNIFEGPFVPNLYPPEHGEQYYKELLEKIGFKDVRATEEERRVPYDTEEDFEEKFLDELMDNLDILPEDEERFKAEVLELFEKTFGRYEGKRCYVSVHLNLFGVKPMESSDSEI